ncbi:hypothetical protein HDU78_009663, partial [Chytriomyces hyalinus]
MGQPTSPVRVSSGTSGGGARSGASALGGATLAGVALLAAWLLQPILAPFAWAVALSVPLHRTKTRLLARTEGVTVAGALAAVAARAAKFVLGPVFSLLDGYVSAYARAIASPAPDQNPAVSFVLSSDPEPWSLWTFKWSLRYSLLASLFSPNAFVRNATAFSLVAFLSTYFTLKLSTKDAVNSSSTTSTPAVPAQANSNMPPKHFWNNRITTLLVCALVAAPLSTAAFFTNSLISVTPDLIHSAVIFMANPIPPHVPKPKGLVASVPDLGIRSWILENGISEVRKAVLDTCNAELARSFPPYLRSDGVLVQNVTCVDMATTAMGGLAIYEEVVYGESKEANANAALNSTESKSAAAAVFRKRFPRVAEVIELAAYGRRLKVAGKLGGAIAEVRWMGPEAFLLSSSVNPPVKRDDSDDEPAESETVILERGTLEDYDPTSAVAGVLGPLVADGGFAALVFFSTIWVLIASDIGVSGYLSKMVGKDLSSALTDPLINSYNLNMHLFFFRIYLTHLCSCMFFPKGTEGFQALMPFLAFAATLLPMFPPFLPLGVLPAVVLFLAYKAPLAAVAVLYVQMFWSPEPDILNAEMGQDGIA